MTKGIKVVVSHSGRAGPIYHSAREYEARVGCVAYGEVLSLEEAKRRGLRPCKRCMVR